MFADKTNIELLFFDGCPNHVAAEELLRRILTEEGIRARITRVRVETLDDARKHRFPGSPTIRLDGDDVDPTPDDGEYSLRCRVYQKNGGLSGLPNKEVVRAALVQALSKRRGNKPLP